jgi:hypothetical protein
MSKFQGFSALGYAAWRDEKVIVYGHRDIWHDTANGDQPLCWEWGMSTISEPTPGYEDPSWGYPHLIARGEVVDKGFRQCRRCRRNLGWGIGYIKTLIDKSLIDA